MVRHRLMTHPLFYAQAATLEVSKSKQEELDNYNSGCFYYECWDEA